MTYPKCQKIDLLVEQPAVKALPDLVAFFGDPDEAVANHALEMIEKHYYHEAEPYIKDALKSSNKRIVDRALFAIGWLGYTSLKDQVRNVVWSSNEHGIQSSATMTLSELGDGEGVQEVAQKHPNEKLRHIAEKILKDFHAEEGEN